MPKLYLLLGGNLGDRLRYLQQARKKLAARLGLVTRSSSIYETAAWGNTHQPTFLNQVLEVETELPPEQVLQEINSIEQELGRVRHEHWGSRVIDIDILFYSVLVLQTQRLTVPHPQLHNRRFTLQPLAELVPELLHPVLNKTIAELLADCLDALEVKRYQKPE